MSLELDGDKLVRKGLSSEAKRLLGMRQESEHTSQQLHGQFDARFKMGTPDMPDAQVVYSHASNTFGVAIKGARQVCKLPKGYGSKGFELALIDGGRLIGIQPDMPPLALNPETGECVRL